MEKELNLRWQIKRTIILGLPIVLSQILQMLIGVTDTVMVARLGELPLAQITLGTQAMFFAIIFTIGFSIPIGAIVSQGLGRNDERSIRRALRMGFWQAGMFSIVFIPFAMQSRKIFSALGQDPTVIEGAGSYVDVALWSLPIVFLLSGFRNYLYPLERNVILMMISLLGVLVNIVANYLLIFGKFGFPELGLIGSAWATLFTNGAMLIAVTIVVLREPMTKRIELFRNLWKPDWEMFWRLVRLGAPATFGLMSEVGLFQVSTVFMGWIGVRELAAFGLVLQIASLTFMVPLGLSIASTMRAGQAVGRGNRAELMTISKAVMIISLCVMIASASLMLLAPNWLISLFLDENRPDSAALTALGVSYLAYAAAFQIFDGLQVSFMGLLRGLLDMFWPAVLAFIAYWLIGMPTGYYLAFNKGWQGEGIWMGLVLGLASAALFLGIRFYFETREENFAKRAATS